MTCPDCKPTEYRAERNDVFREAYQLLRGIDWPKGSDDESVAYGVLEVLRVAEYLLGEG